MNSWQLVLIFLTIFGLTLVSFGFLGIEKTTIQKPTVEIQQFYMGMTPTHDVTVTVDVNLYNPNKLEGYLKDIGLRFYLMVPKEYWKGETDANLPGWFYLGRTGIDDLVIPSEPKKVVLTEGDKILLRAVGYTPLRAWAILRDVSFLQKYFGSPGGEVVWIRIEGKATAIFGESSFEIPFVAQIKTTVIVVEV